MKKIKMVLYGEPGVGKSVFACKSPKPFFICSDGNYEWLEDFGAKEEDHIQVSSWSEAKSAFRRDFENYETLVVDLLEDLFKWCEYEFCTKNKIDHVSDIGYGKGYDITRNEFFVEISKLLSLDKNIILICHGLATVVKDRRGVEHTKYIPSSRIPDKVIDMIEGRVRYFLRAYTKDIETADGVITTRRFLSLIPKPNEFGIIRGVNDATIPQDIDLNWNDFVSALGLNELETKSKEEVIEKPKRERKKKVEEDLGETKTPYVVKETEDSSAPWEDVITTPIVLPDVTTEETKEEPVKEEPVKKEPVKEEPAKQEMTNEERINMIKAKLAALKKG